MERLLEAGWSLREQQTPREGKTGFDWEKEHVWILEKGAVVNYQGSPGSCVPKGSSPG